MSSAFARMATVSASTKRATLSNGKRGEPVAYLSGLKCVPLDPLDPETRQTLQLDTPHELLSTMIDGVHDIQESDILVVDGVDYPIRSCAVWTWCSGTVRQLIVENLKR